jgi:hypothetical protein
MAIHATGAGADRPPTHAQRAILGGGRLAPRQSAHARSASMRPPAPIQPRSATSVLCADFSSPASFLVITDVGVPVARPLRQPTARPAPARLTRAAAGKQPQRTTILRRSGRPTGRRTTATQSDCWSGDTRNRPSRSTPASSEAGHDPRGGADPVLAVLELGTAPPPIGAVRGPRSLLTALSGPAIAPISRGVCPICARPAKPNR